MGREATVSDSTLTQDHTVAILIACCLDTACPDELPKMLVSIVWPNKERDSESPSTFVFLLKKSNKPKALWIVIH